MTKPTTCINGGAHVDQSNLAHCDYCGEECCDYCIDYHEDCDLNPELMEDDD